MRIPEVAKITVESNTIILRQETINTKLIIIIMNEKQKNDLNTCHVYNVYFPNVNNYDLQ